MPHRRDFGLWLAGVAAAGCASSPDEAAVEPHPMWPAPPELPRYLHEATLRSAASLQDRSETGRLRRALLGDDDAQRSFGKPMGVAARGGRVYVTDTEQRRVFVFDVPRRRTFVFGTRLEGELKKPSGIAADARDRVYVVDTTARRLVIYDKLGLYLSAIDGGADWVRPTSVAVSPDGERIFVVDTGGVESDKHCVRQYDVQGAVVRTIGRRGSGPGEFNLPADAAVAPDGSLWVLDAGNFRVQAFDADGRWQRQFGSVGKGLGQLARPRGMAIDADGLVYLADALLCNVQVFQPDGQLLLALGSRAQTDAPGRYLLPARLAWDETRRLYVVDQYLHKIEVLRRLGDEEGLRLQQSAPSSTPASRKRESATAAQNQIRESARSAFERGPGA
jgi:sugar lactone lactonase YvrE